MFIIYELNSELMKTRLIFLILLIANFSCTTTNKPVTDAEKDKIKEEIKEVVNSYIKGCVEANWDMIREPFIDSPDFIYIINGYALNYKNAVEMSEPAVASMQNLKFTIVDEKYAILDNSTVLYTLNCTNDVNFKDGHSEVYDPCVLLFIFKKIDTKWGLISFVESSVLQSN